MKRTETNYIVIHCSATPATMDIGAKEIREWHQARGWRDIGYHFVIRRDGSIEWGREPDEVGAHAKGFNQDSVAVCMVGGATAEGEAEDNFTEDQWETLEIVVECLRIRHRGARVVGHRDLPGVLKACPSFDVKAWLRRRDGITLREHEVWRCE